MDSKNKISALIYFLIYFEFFLNKIYIVGKNFNIIGIIYIFKVSNVSSSAESNLQSKPCYQTRLPNHENRKFKNIHEKININSQKLFLQEHLVNPNLIFYKKSQDN